MDPVITQQQPPVSPVLAPIHSEESMWSSFQNVLVFISLAFFAGALHTLWSMFINYWLPPVGDSYLYAISNYLLNPAIATLVVSAPMFIILFLITNKKYTTQPELKKTKTKKILNYLALVITFIILISRSVSAVTSALNDSFTANFGYQLLVTFLICGAIFAYYLYEVRIEKQAASILIYSILSVFISILAVATLLISLSIRGKLKTKVEETNNKYKVASPVQNDYSQNNYSGLPSYDTSKTILATSTNLPSVVQTIQGIDFIIDSADVYSSGENKFLELNLIFSATSPCPLTGGAVCGINSIGIHGYDKDGFKLQPFLAADVVDNDILKEGEKVKGKYFFNVNDLQNSYYVTYGTPDGQSTSKIEILMQAK